MATWEDGPEYAPLERPADFAVPPGAPLDAAPAAPQLAAGAPRDRPLFADPPVPVAPLAALVPDVKDPRDPQLPFEVASSNMTSNSAWGALQPSLQAPQPDANLLGGGPAPFAVPDIPEGPTSGYPAPGTPDWFAPSPYDPPQPPTPVTLKQVLNAATPGLCICLVIGGLIFVLSPIMLAIAFGLASRVSAARPAVRKAFTFAVAAVGFIAVIAALTNLTGFADWWDLVGAWALFFCWVMLAVTTGLIYRALKQQGSPPPHRPTWG